MSGNKIQDSVATTKEMNFVNASFIFKKKNLNVTEWFDQIKYAKGWGTTVNDIKVSKNRIVSLIFLIFNLSNFILIYDIFLLVSFFLALSYIWV